MDLLFLNFFVQCSTVALSLFGGYVLRLFAAEEFVLYKKQLRIVVVFLMFATLFIPLVFLNTIIPFGVLFFVYALIFWKKREEHVQAFFYLAPLTLFLASNNQKLFFVTLCLFLLAVLAESCQTKIVWRKYISFIVVTVFVYGLTWITTLK